MEQGTVVPFFKLISSMLLVKKVLKPIDIVNIMSRLQEFGIIVDDYNDSINCISCCVEMKNDCSFCIKRNYNYGYKLDDSFTVKDFLLSHSDNNINSFLQQLVKNNEISDDVNCRNVRMVDRDIKRKKLLSFFAKK